MEAINGAVRDALREVDTRLKGFTPSQIVLSTLVTVYVLYITNALLSAIQEQGLKRFIGTAVIRFAKLVPGAKGAIDKENEKMLGKMEKMILGKVDQGERRTALPKTGVSEADLVKTLEQWKAAEEKVWKSGQVSGSVYHGGEKLQQLLNRVYGMFSMSNPLHPDVFPYVRKMEAEVVRMACTMFHGDEDVVGTMTSGGTESILMAMKVYRDQAREVRGITHPEVIAPDSAHAAFDKAAQYFGIKLIKLPMTKEFKADLRAMEKAITKNTVALVGSAPAFPQGVMDPIEQLGKLAEKYGLGLHVDSCLGGFLLPHLADLGYDVPKFDFQVPQVTSMSADPHKFGFAPKGSSLVLYRNKDWRRFQYFCAPSWPGGIYACPSMPGSRAGGLIAACWAAMVHIGKDGYMKYADEIMKTTIAIKQGIAKIDGLFVMGDPVMSVVAFGSDEKKVGDVYKVGEAMSKRGWHLNTLQYPKSVHICVTYMHVQKAAQFISDLEASAKEVRENPGGFKDGSAAIYGMAESIPDRSMVVELAKGFVDTLYRT